MKNKISAMCSASALFLILLLASGTVAGIMSEIIYLFAFMLPLCVLLRVRSEEKGKKFFTMSRAGWESFMPLLFPSVLLVSLVSFLSSAFFYLIFGVSNSADVGTNLPFALFYHALLPAVLEELLFRYAPLRLFGFNASKTLIFTSATLFALVHIDLFTIPYAFVAGVIFMTVDIMCKSVIPSMLMHFVNNFVSVLLIFYADEGFFGYILFVFVLFASLVSAFVIFKKRREYALKIKSAIGRERLILSRELLIFTVPMLIICAVDLLGRI